MAPFPAGAGLAPHLDLGLPPRGLRSRQRGPRLGPLHVGSSGRATSGRGPGVVWPDEGPVMTRARALKQAIRARAAKTGERYTTARRHVLKTLGPRATPAAPAPTAAPATSGRAACQRRRVRHQGPREDRSRPRPLVRGARIDLAASRRGTPLRHDTWPRTTMSTAGTRKASRSPTNGPAACARSISEPAASTKCRPRRSWPRTPPP